MPGGRPRKPARLKLLEGNRGKRAIKQEPEPRRGAPEAPTHLSVRALAIWEKVAEELDRLGLISQVDGVALEGFCTAYSRAVDCDKIIREQGMTFEIKPGLHYQRPEISISRNCWRQVKEFCTEFGLTPASRGKLSVGATEHEIDVESEALLG